MKSLATARALGVVVDIADEAEPPNDRVEADRLLRVVHNADRALDELHGLCDAHPDRYGRCIDCGRLIGWPSPRLAHKRGGCLMAVPFLGTALWLRHNYMSLPFVGKALWHLRRREGT